MAVLFVPQPVGNRTLARSFANCSPDFENRSRITPTRTHLFCLLKISRCFYKFNAIVFFVFSNNRCTIKGQNNRLLINRNIVTFAEPYTTYKRDRNELLYIYGPRCLEMICNRILTLQRNLREPRGLRTELNLEEMRVCVRTLI